MLDGLVGDVVDGLSGDNSTHSRERLFSFYLLGTHGGRILLWDGRRLALLSEL